MPRRAARCQFEGISGESPAIHAAIRQARRFARVDGSIPLMGETGAGRELFTPFIHSESERANGLFVAVNRVAMPENRW